MISERIASGATIHDDEMAVMLYNIVASDRSTWRYLDETFDFTGEKANLALAYSTVRSEPPHLRVCPLAKLRQIAAK